MCKNINMFDEYSHQDKNIFYVDENIPGPTENTDEYKQLKENFNSQLIHHCECILKCCEGTCYCFKISGGSNYISFVDQTIYKDMIYLLNKSKVNCNYPIIECNESCRCVSQCGNRLVQNGPLKYLYMQICKNKLKGLGLFSYNHILRGMFICEYAGEVITKSQALRRHEHNQAQGKMNYIFCLQEHINEEILQTFIDPSKFGNIGRYINHSCEPNCEIIPVRVNNPIPKLAIFSSTDIFPGTEITIDYGASSLNLITATVNIRKPCLCESSKCKNLMPYHSY